jgi:hypothetical protein
MLSLGGSSDILPKAVRSPKCGHGSKLHSFHLAVLIRRELSQRRPGGLVWKRKAREAKSSTGTEEGATILVGSVLCRLPAEDVRPEKHVPERREGGKVLHAPDNVHGERGKRTRLVLAARREIVGPGFSDGPKACMVRLGSESWEAMRQPGSARKTTAPGTLPEPRWCPAGLTSVGRLRN